jgi:hypothetical protein
LPGPGAGGPGGRKDLDHRAVGLGQNKDRIAAGTALQEVNDALEANREPACGHVLVQGPADELVVTPPPVAELRIFRWLISKTCPVW